MMMMMMMSCLSADYNVHMRKATGRYESRSSCFVQFVQCFVYSGLLSVFSAGSLHTFCFHVAMKESADRRCRRLVKSFLCWLHVPVGLLWAPALIWHQVLVGFKQNPSCFSEECFCFQLWHLFSWRYRNKKQLTESDPPCSDKSAASCNQTVSEITFHFVFMFSCYSCSLPHIVPDWNVSQAWSQSSFPGSLMETGFVYFTDNQHMLAHTVTWEDPQDKPQQLTCCWLYMFVLSILNQVRD